MPIITYSGCSVFELHRCITSLLAMVSIAMTKEVKRTTVSSLDHSVKTYLSFFHVIHSSLLDKSTTPKKMNKKLGYTCEANDGAKKCDASQGAGVNQDLCMWKKNKCNCSKEWCRPTDAAPAKVSAR